MKNNILLIVKLLMKDDNAKEEIIKDILQQVDKRSYIGNQLNEELYAYIIENICKDIVNFKIY